MENQKLWNQRDQLYCAVEKIHKIKRERKKEVVKPNDLLIAKNESMDSDEDDEEPQDEQGTSSTSQPFVPVPPLKQGPTTVRTLEGHCSTQI